MDTATMRAIFKAYDIRGEYGTELTDDLAYRTARATVRFLKKDGNLETITLALGRDMRLSSPALHARVLQGLREEGAHVVDFGLVSTPAFYFGVASEGVDAGVMITASHNPGKDNGIKIVRRGASPVGSDSGLFDIRDMALETDFSPVTEDALGSLTEKTDIVQRDVDFAFDFCGGHATVTQRIKPLKVVIDAANAMGATYLKGAFAKLPCEVIELNTELDGNFPAHEADPFHEANNAQLEAAIREHNADFGVATDGDGDRIFFFDNTGAMIAPAIVRGLMAQIMLQQHPGATICYDIRPGKITRDMIVAAGGRPVVTRVGHSFIKATAIAEDAVFAGESSGHLFVRTELGTFETPVIVLLKLLEHFSAGEGTIDEQVAPYRKYIHSGEINSIVEDKDAAMARVKEVYGPAAERIDEMDGITIEYPDFWFNVRGSNTEPKLRLNLEAISADICKEKTDEVLALIRQ